ncbi:arsenate reductase family protein [Candidatus Saccharibacteria bacterium]|nr:MAG: arsenate reductase family protein [Candidatus Saccharibacteria bacterium]
MKFYCYKKCSTCKKAAAFLRARGVKFEEIDYTEQPLTAKELHTYWQVSDLPLKKFFNTSGLLYREMDIKDKLLTMTEDEQLELLARHPMLVRRPILVLSDAVLVGFDETKWTSTLNKEDQS